MHGLTKWETRGRSFFFLSPGARCVDALGEGMTTQEEDGEEVDDVKSGGHVS